MKQEKNQLSHLDTFDGFYKSKHGMLVMLIIIYSMTMPLLTIFSTVYPKWAGGYFNWGDLLLSFIPMLIGDILVECYGWKKGLTITSIIYAVQLIFIGLVQITVAAPMDPYLTSTVVSEGYAAILGTNWRITIAGAVGYYFGIIANTYIMGTLKKKYKDHDTTFKFFTRCIVSTVAGQFLDNFLFMFIAFAPFGLTAVELPWQVLIVNAACITLLEIAYETVLFPVTKVLTKKINSLPLYYGNEV